MSRLALACALLAASPLGARAQTVVRVEAPSCPPAWWHEGEFVDALRVELAREPIDVERAGEGDAGVLLTLSRPVCDDAGETLVVALGDDAQPVSLADLSPEARTRALAITTADRVLAMLASAEPAPEADALLPAEARDPPSFAPNASGELGDPLIAPSVLAPEPAHDDPPAASAVVPPEPAHDDRSPAAGNPFELRVSAGGLVFATASTLHAFGGATVAAELTFGPVPLALRIAPILFHGGAGQELGVVKALGGGAALGAGVDLRVGFVRIVPRLDVGVVHVALDATTTAPGVTAHDAERELVWVQPGASVGLDVDAFFAALELAVPLVVRGVEARAGDQPVLAITGALLRAELTLGARITL